MNNYEIFSTSSTFFPFLKNVKKKRFRNLSLTEKDPFSNDWASLRADKIILTHLILILNVASVNTIY